MMKSAAVFFALVLANLTVAQEFPARPLRIVVPYPAGGGSDILGRTIAKALTESLGQQVIVENRPGANGNIGAEVVARSAPDGYTLLVTDNAIAISPSLYTKLGYEFTRDLAPVTLLHASAHVLTVHPSVPARSVNELITLAKANPGKLNFGSSGAGSSLHLSAELFQQSAGIKLVHIPFKGAAPAVAALIGGEVDLLISGILPVMQQIKSGRVRALAVTALERSVALPDVPTIAEAVPLPGFETILWGAVFVPSGTPKPVVDKLSNEIARILKSREIREFLAAQGANAASSTPEQLEKRLKADVAMWGRLVRSSGAKVE